MFVLSQLFNLSVAIFSKPTMCLLNYILYVVWYIRGLITATVFSQVSDWCHCWLISTHWITVSYPVTYRADVECVWLSINSGTKQMFSQGMADVLLDACSDFWDGHDIRPLGTEERYKSSVLLLSPVNLAQYSTHLGYSEVTRGEVRSPCQNLLLISGACFYQPGALLVGKPTVSKHRMELHIELDCSCKRCCCCFLLTCVSDCSLYDSCQKSPSVFFA